MNTARQLWILAGGNGAGKTTFYHRFLEPLGMKFVNADLIAAEISDGGSEDHSYVASRVAGQLRNDLLKTGTSFCFETVFSHPSKIDFIADAKTLGFEVILVFIHLHSNQLNQARVAQRVSEGGHGVPADKIISRIPRTLDHIRTVLPLTDQTQIYDNSSLSQPFVSIAHLDGSQLIRQIEPLPEWAVELLKDYI